MTMEMMVVLGYYSLSAKGNWLQEVTYANGGLKVWCEKDTSKNTSVPSEGDEAETAGSDGSPVEGIALQHHGDESRERKQRQGRADTELSSRESEGSRYQLRKGMARLEEASGSRHHEEFSTSHMYPAILFTDPRRSCRGGRIEAG